MEPKEILSRARHIQWRMDRRQAELSRIREMRSYIGAVSYDKVVVAHSAGRGPVEQMATDARLDRLEQRIRQDLDELTKAKLEAIGLIGLLEDPRMQEVLWEYYIRGAKNWDEAAEHLYMGRRTALRLHGQALQLLRLALNGTDNL